MNTTNIKYDEQSNMMRYYINNRIALKNKLYDDKLNQQFKTIKKINKIKEMNNNTIYKFIAEYDEIGVYFYQAYNKNIAKYAVENQTFKGCPKFSLNRMTWIKPNFAWMLYRAGYGIKDKNQAAILKIKLSHDTVAQILENSVLSHNKDSKGKTRIQWDPARNLFMPTTNKDSDKENNLVEPAKLSAIKVKDEELLKQIQIGINRMDVSKIYVDNILSITDVSELALQIYDIHQSSLLDKTCKDIIIYPREQMYVPKLTDDKLLELQIRK